MNLSAYFEDNKGIGILSTAGSDGDVNAAVYAKPHVLGGDTIGFIMRDRLSRANLQQNKRAHYLFVEEGGKASGIRLHIELISETDEEEVLQKYSRRKGAAGDQEDRYFATFTVNRALRLIGGDEISVD